MKREIAWIQALRGIAALLVVICHARVVLRGTAWEPLAEHWLTPGALGVDLFFMISGFIMVYTTTDCDGTIRYASTFLIKRFARVFPVYMAAVLLSTVLTRTHLIEPPKDLPSFLSTAKSLLFIPIDASKPPFFGTPYDVGWTLNFEMYFYLVFGIATLFGRHRWKVLAAWFALTLIAIPVAFSGHGGLDVRQNYGIENAYLALIANPIIWEFGVGVAIGRIYLSRLTLPRNALSLALVAGSVVFAVWYDFSWHGTFNGLDQWGTPLPIMLLLFALTSNRRGFNVPSPIVWLGGVSYSLYLFHPLASSVLRSIAASAGLAWLIHTWWGVAAIIAFSVVVAKGANELLERALSTWVRDRLLARAFANGQKASSSSL